MLSRREHIERLKKMAQPLALAELERKGIISKAGAWYKVPDFQKLPEHAWIKIRDFDQRGQRVKFYKGLEKSAAKLLKLDTRHDSRMPGNSITFAELDEIIRKKQKGK